MRQATALIVLAACLGGCVERTISITSEPSGALVHLNDEEVGRTPLTVPFTYYGVYDVRLDREPSWFSFETARYLLDVSEGELRDMIARDEVTSRNSADGTEVLLAFKPNWTEAEAKAPWWENPGPDLIAEAIPDNDVNLQWHFNLEARPRVRHESLIDRANQMRALSDEPGEQ